MSNIQTQIMIKTLLFATSVVFLCYTNNTYAQGPVLGESSNFALFSSNGAVSNTGLSHLTGNVGTNNGSSTNFGNVDGVMHDADGTTADAAADLIIAYNELNAAIPNFFPAPLLGNGQKLEAGTYAIGQSATLDNTLILDGKGNKNSIFIFQIEGSFSSAAGAKVELINGALACNVFWKIEGLVDLATNTQMKGTVVANNAAIILNTGSTLEGRALSTTGAVTVAGVTVTTPLGCGSPILKGPAAPELKSVACYTIFSGNGEVTNSGVSTITGDVGSNLGLTTGFQEVNVVGTIHAIPDTSTAECAEDLGTVYDYLNTLPVDIELLYPAAFGQNIVLTPHTYLMNAATVLNGTVILNAQDNVDAVFVIKINGALSTSTYAKVELQNGAQAKNVFWKVEGAININDYSEFKGTVIGNNGAVILNTGVILDGRVLSTSGGITTFGIDAEMSPGCNALGIKDNASKNKSAHFSPNPFKSTLNVARDNFDTNAAELTIYNALGVLVLKTTLMETRTSIPMNLSSGMYYYSLKGKDGSQQNGKLISN